MRPDDFRCDGFSRYAGAKLMLNAFSATLSRRRAASAIGTYTSNVYDPGGSIDTPGEGSFRASRPRRRAAGRCAASRWGRR